MFLADETYDVDKFNKEEKERDKAEVSARWFWSHLLVVDMPRLASKRMAELS